MKRRNEIKFFRQKIVVCKQNTDIYIDRDENSHENRSYSQTLIHFENDEYNFVILVLLFSFFQRKSFELYELLRIDINIILQNFLLKS